MAEAGRTPHRGYTFVTLDEAMQDEDLRTADEFVGPSGVSWLHRWRSTLGRENRLREEPDPPKWVIEAYRAQAKGEP